MPVTPYRSFPCGEVNSQNQRCIEGIDAMIREGQSLKAMGDTLVNRSLFPHATVSFRYHIAMADIVMGPDQLMTKWRLTSSNVVAFGGAREVEKQGMLMMTFKEGKITR